MESSLGPSLVTRPPYPLYPQSPARAPYLRLQHSDSRTLRSGSGSYGIPRGGRKRRRRTQSFAETVLTICPWKGSFLGAGAGLYVWHSQRNSVLALLWSRGPRVCEKVSPIRSSNPAKPLLDLSGFVSWMGNGMRPQNVFYFKRTDLLTR